MRDRSTRGGRPCALVACIAACAFLVAGCRREGTVSSLEEKKIFTLDYGNFENQLNVFSLLSVNTINTNFVMQDGFFYIMNGENHKIMALNNFGELVTFFYNPEYNTAPAYIKSPSVKEATVKAVEYAFNDITCLSVGADKSLYVVDRLPVTRQELDKESGQILGQIVLRFSSDGHFIDYIGQQGPGGSPFPYIKSIHSTNRNEFVVVCVSGDGYIAYWFSAKGYLLYKISIDKNSVPSPYSAEDGDLYPSIGTVIPDYTSRTLYLSVDYYSKYIDTSSHLQSGVVYKSSYIYPLSAEDGTFGAPLEILPNVEQSTEEFSSEKYEIPYDFLGVTESGWFFFMASTESGFELQMVQGNGERILRRRLPFNRSETLYYTFSLSRTGILSVMAIKNEYAEIDWWRTDSLIQSVVNK